MPPGRSLRRAQKEKPQQIADELRGLIVSGELADGDSLGREPELVERFGVSRPSLREALRILETDGLIEVVRGLHGGVVVRSPASPVAARTAALVLQARRVPLADVLEARSMLESLAARSVTSLRSRKRAAAELRRLIDEEGTALVDPVAFGQADAVFHARLVALAGNQTLTLLAEMLNDIVSRAGAAIDRDRELDGSLATRRKAIRSQERLVELIEQGDPTAVEEHWRAHPAMVTRVVPGRPVTGAIDLLDDGY